MDLNDPQSTSLAIDEPTSANTVDRADAIRQGKEKAREVVESSLSTPPIDPHSRTNSKSPVVNSSAPDSPSRKRSRSGSRLPNQSDPSSTRAIVPATSSTPQADPHLRQYIWRDQLSAVAQSRQEEDMRVIINKMHDDIKMWKDARRSNPADPGWIYGTGFQGYGNGWTAPIQPMGLPPKVMYPRNRKKPGRRRTTELRWNRRARDVQKERPEDLVPIRLDLEIDKLRLRDTFTWNVHDFLVPPRLFAEGLVEDFKIPVENCLPFVEQVYASLTEQIHDFHPHLFFDEEPLDPHLPYMAYKNDDMRILVKLNITIGNHSLVDRFDWDINNPANSPEEFAAGMASDLGLSGEFMTAIAHSIREQAQMFTKGLYISAHPFDGRPVEDPDLRENVLPSPLPSVFRPYQAAKEFTPYFFELNEAELEKTEDAFLREQRQQKRSVNRRGGPSLPDLKERLRTVRTMVVSENVPGAAATLEESGIFRPTTRTTGRGRRSYRVDDHGSEVSESEESDGGSPNRAAMQTTARTRGMRGAASAAQAAMRANFNTSPSPERQDTSRLRRGAVELKEDSDGETVGIVVHLKMPRERYRRWWREYKQTRQNVVEEQAKRDRAYQVQQQRIANFPGTPQRFQPPSMRPPESRQVDPQSRPKSNHTPQPSANRGPTDSPAARVMSNGPTAAQSTPQPRTQPLAPTLQPPAPQWLVAALDELRSQNPNQGEFEGTTRYDHEGGTWQPRIRCLTCANNILYKTDETEPIKNFLQHFNHDNHKNKVMQAAASRR